MVHDVKFEGDIVVKLCALQVTYSVLDRRPFIPENRKKALFSRMTIVCSVCIN